ncbi:hypothetical protein A2634_05005 [Candidatus Amesbacteria bacterium RIFCSPHIGHO2_01_FULL_48_32]|uniref:Glycosyltransferase 2-like domain-containing protein n=1 Tax=Candidatus Amesbacteria bacterium RIFCSPLOWO2_01_FULL_48_25 TaxID=1797259 RepID=A0A1F4ZEG4_9BACT|nr:MAG: hypothetical protein A2634_05005 [Candidatus Amesbacteria bacterium RIFCSPHIGHO2_01_FULL_48_32]OGD04027.1 MAG: hypothetical protein A2989_01355 [Candidatus Amesbacteria bacterium RIFCSPLOWO2_01_FULL_48_25]
MLSVVITAWNEEKNIARAISSAKTIADEIVVVDTESTDKTAEIAKKLGAKIYGHKNTGIVEPVRNFSISKARGDWILLLDADEEITQPLAKIIKETIKNASADYYRFPRQNTIFGKWIKSNHWWPDYVYRLFKKGSMTWDPTIHSIPYTRGIGHDFLADEEHAIIHHHYDTIFQYVDRLNRYTDHQLDLVQSRGYNFNWIDIIDKPFAEFITQYFSRQGYTQGLHGLALSSLQAFSELVLYLKLWQQSKFVSQEITPAQLENQIGKKSSEWKWWSYQAKIDQANILVKPFLKLLRKLS